MKQLPSIRFIAILSAVLLTIAFTVLYTTYSAGPLPTPTQLDTLFYYQYAQAIADGHPYQFTQDQPPSTGSTSHLLPYVLAGFIKIGFSGHRLAIASYGLGIVCLGVSLWLLDRIERILFPTSKGLGLLFCALSGPFLFTMLSESDIVLFTPLILGAFLGWVTGRKILLTVLLVAAAWTRPEGMVFAGLLFTGTCWFAMRPEQKEWAKGLLIPSGIGLVASCLVLLLNTLLTGNPVFSSVTQKNFLGEDVMILSMLYNISLETNEILRDYFMGLSMGNRGYTLFPILGCVLFLGGLGIRPWKPDRLSFMEGIFWLSALAAVLLSASGGFSGLMFDRYFGWFLPMMLLYSVGWLNKLWKEGHKPAVTLISALLLGFQILGIFFMLGSFAENNRYMAGKVEAARDINATLPPNSNILSNGTVGLQFYLPGHTVFNFFGITNTDLEFTRFYTQNFDLFKHEPAYRAPYWLFQKSDSDQFWLEDLNAKPIFEEITLQPTEKNLILFEVDWGIFDTPPLPRTPKVLEAVADLELIDTFDIGYTRHEEEHDHTIRSTLKSVTLFPGILVKTLEGTKTMDTGDMIVGRHSFTVQTVPEKDLTMVMRTASFADFAVNTLQHPPERKNFFIGSPLQLRLFVDGKHVSDLQVAIDPDPNTFSEVTIPIPASHIITDQTRITLSGEHIATGFWFYQ